MSSLVFLTAAAAGTPEGPAPSSLDPIVDELVADVVDDREEFVVDAPELAEPEEQLSPLMSGRIPVLLSALVTSLERLRKSLQSEIGEKSDW